MAKPKRKRAKKPVRVPGVTVYEPVKRPQSLPEDLLARPATGKHRDCSEAGYGTGGGEWGFINANRARPRPMAANFDHEEAMAKVRLLLGVEDCLKACADVHVNTVGYRARGERYVPRERTDRVWIGGRLVYR